MDQLEDIYGDPSQPGSFGGVDNLYRDARRRGIRVSKKDVENWLSKKLSYTLHKPARKNFKRNRTLVFFINETWQIDLLSTANLKEHNDDATFILTVIDLFSKMAFAKTLKDKRSVTVLKGFINILEESGRKPQKVQSDAGLEFHNKSFRKALADRAIKFYTTFSEIKCGTVERFNRTLRARMYRYFTHKNTYRYVDVLPQLIKAYNASPHRGIKGRSPDSVTPHNSLKVWRDSHAQKRPCRSKFKFKVGDKVRISRDKGIFGRGYTHNWSEEYFIVEKAIPRVPPVYTLKDLNSETLKGVFYEPQLQSISPDEVYPISEVRKKNKRRALVSWRGWPSPAFDSWIPLADIQKI